MKNPLILICILHLFTLTSFAQDSARIQRNLPDSSRQFRDTTNNRTDTARRQRGFNELFADSAKLTSSDFQLAIEKNYVMLDNVDNKSELGLGVQLIIERQADNDSVLAVLKDNVLNNASALNLRNLQVFRTLLMNIQREAKDHRELLDSTEHRLNDLRSSLKTFRQDTVLRQLYRDTAMRQQFSAQLKDMRQNWRKSTTHLKESLATVNMLQTKTSSHAITATQLLEKVESLLDTSAARIFGKEYNYLWESDTTHLSAYAKSSFDKVYDGERKALRYYFKDSGNKRLFLLLIGFIFFLWMFRNIRKLKKLNGLQSLKEMEFDYLPSGYIVSAFIIMFSIAPLFDLHAPSAYIESMQFLLLVILSIICWKKWPRKLFWNWMAMVVLYICFSFMHHVADPGLGIRLWLILLNGLSVFFGWMFLTRMKDNLQLKGFLRFVIILHNVMNVLSILCNISGRFSLAQILGNTAIFSFTQAIGLAVFSKIAMEAILLQIVTSRAKRGVSSRLDYEPVLNGFRKPLLFLVVILWVIVFTTNLNIYTNVLNGLSDFLSRDRSIGNASFTLGGVLLFFMIIWIAHLLQKYVGYFFGDTGNDDEVHNKSQRSRLLIARLVLLCLGYLLAVAASGVPVDKITIVLGALGVGIGLGLQNIVNNFVSGIILIFDRPLQIGDSVEVGDKTGRVREIGLRSSTLMTADGAEVIIPNGDILSQQIVNYTLTNNQIRLEMDLSVSGSKDMEVVASAIKEAIGSSEFVFENREPQVLFTKVNENGYDVKAYFWCADVFKSEEAKSDVLIRLHQQMEAKNLSVD
ncbi:mechanosensitive ion channel family protein [Pseudobacter ginsenosidimutans]|uniref:Mechanosensitive ion channel-like protein n=1 Tax=Pseudobacter ginsenosidimutans TaxID=661488 RepID=A0A4Q7MG13_9BACT|nr:mechanosensitive ion channel domain-containing protein [Pseudobacter ginsenosidimutans]QEC45580.1 mechanosensitive ion channel [Pseudobacter ginsenosidimutans]RZS67126.1 mechanosensitive ion channel-like protein [Pseudobacter ginsenosidimutans]